MTPTRMRSDAGFTLVEMMVAVLLFALVAGSIYEIWVRGERSQQVGLELAEASQNARAGVDLIAREIRSAGYGVDPTVQPSIVVGSQYRVTFALDINGNRKIDMGEVITYFLDPSTTTALATASSNPYDYVLRRKVGTSADSLATPAAGTGEIVAYGLTQRSSDAVTTKNQPLFSYVDASGVALETKAGTSFDPAGAFYGRTVSDADLGKPPAPGVSSKVKRVVVNMVTETRQKNVQTGGYDRISVNTAVEPRNFPYLAQANVAYAANTGATGTGTGTSTSTSTGTGTGTSTSTSTGTGSGTGTGTGTGLPPSQPPIHIPTDQVLSLALADLNEVDSKEGSATVEDGQHDLDIIVGTKASGVANIRVWWNGQPGRYTGNVYYQSTQNYMGNASYDVPAVHARNIDKSDNNSRDIITGVVTGSLTGRFQVWQNQAFGNPGETPGMVGTVSNPVTPNASYYDNPGTGEVRAVATGDMNGDGNRDVVIGTKTNATQGKVEVWWGDGAGGFSHSPTLDVYTASGAVRSIAVADMNRDGYLDIVAGTKTNGTGTQGNIDIFFGSLLTIGRFTTSYTVAAGGAVHSLAVARMDADDFPDVVTAVQNGSASGQIEFWRGNGTLAGALSRRDIQVTPGPALCVAVGLLDDNSSNDIVVGTAGAGGATPPAVQAFFCDPTAASGAIIPDFFSWADANAGGAVNALAVGRLECSQDRLGDDRLGDIVAGTATSASTGDLVIYLNPYASVYVP